MALTQLRFGEFRLDLVNLCLWTQGSRCELAPKTFDLLRYLAENPGRLLTKRELLDAVWPGQFVTEAVLKVQIGRLRKLLGDAAHWVVTEPKRGYRFSTEVRSGSLPIALSGFTGREQELEQLEATVTGRRLVTLVGAGGSGKTRLALELANRLDSFVDGLHWVELAGVPKGERVGTQIARCFGVREGEDGALAQPLTSALGGRHLLLVLDNCEHVIDACAEWATTLVAGCPRVHLLATSREALGVDGELVCPVEPLPLPKAESDDAGHLRANPAVRLFADRLTSLGWPQPLTEPELLVVAQICRRLDGMPLALELAAARVPSLGLETVAARLDDAPGLLTVGRRSAPSRHRTLAAAIDWSYRLLDDEEGRLFARLSVFRGGFDGARVQAVCGETTQGSEALDRLAALADRSLVVALPQSVGMRYRLLEPVRQVAAHHLETNRADAAGTRERHAGWCLDLASECEPLLRSGARGSCLERLDSELDNLRAAMAWADPPPELGSVAARVSADLQWYWYHRGHWLEGRENLAQGLASGRERDPERAAGARAAMGKIDFFRGAYSHGFEGLDQARRDLESLGDEALGAEATSFLALCALALGDAPLAWQLASQAVARIRPLPEAWRLGILLVNLGNVERHRNELGAAAECYRESIEIFDELHDAWALGMAYRNLGMNDACRGAIDSSFDHLQHSLRQLRATGERWFISRGLEELAANLVAQQRLDDASRLFGAGEALRDSVGAPLVPFYRSAYDEAVATGRHGMPNQAWEAAWQEGRSMLLEEALSFALDLS